MKLMAIDEHVAVESRQGWRDWLAEHYAASGACGP